MKPYTFWGRHGRPLFIAAMVTLALLVAAVLWWLGHRLSGLAPDVPELQWLPLAISIWAAGLLWISRVVKRLRGVQDGTGLPALPARSANLDLVVGYHGRRPIIIPERDRYLHVLVDGTTGTGKSSRLLKPMIWQDLLAMAHGSKLGVTVIEPKGDLVHDIAEMCDLLGIPYILIDPERPDTKRFNPLHGDGETAAEVLRTVLAALFGKQDAFFSQVQATLTQYLVQMLKHLRGDRLSLNDVLGALTDAALLRQYVDEYRSKGGEMLVIQFFEHEVLGRLADKFFQFALGVRAQLGEITGNSLLRRVLQGESDVDLDRHLAEGGVLLVNTAMGRLGRLGDTFGRFVMLNVQYAVFRRPGTENTRIPHVLLIDEFPRYVTPDFERTLALGRSYRCATVLACQTTTQFAVDYGEELRDVFVGLCRHKIILGLEDLEDAKFFSQSFGNRAKMVEQVTYKRHHLFGPLSMHAADSMRTTPDEELLFRPEDLLHLPAFHAAIKVTVDDQPQRAVFARLSLSGYDLNRKKWQRWSRRRHRGPIREVGPAEAGATATTAAGSRPVDRGTVAAKPLPVETDPGQESIAQQEKGVEQGEHVVPADAPPASSGGGSPSSGKPTPPPLAPQHNPQQAYFFPQAASRQRKGGTPG